MYMKPININDIPKKNSGRYEEILSVFINAKSDINAVELFLDNNASARVFMINKIKEKGWDIKVIFRQNRLFLIRGDSNASKR